MDSLRQYLIPESSISSVILYVLLALSVVWAIIFFGWMRRLNVWGSELSEGQNVGALTGFLEEVGAGGVPAAEQPVRAAEAFADFLRVTGLGEQSPVVRHVRAIFDAGWKGTRLDIDRLIQHTAGIMFRAQALLRAVLAVFIIVGLLGTLFGLAASLSQMSNATQVSGARSGAELTKGLGELLLQLRSAFAPSIWGIIATLLFVLLLAFYFHYKALPVRSELERVTLAVWVPKLMPSTATRFLEGLNRSEEHVRQNAVTVARMAEFSRHIEEESSLFRRNLQAAGDPLRDLATSAEKLNDFADKFAAGARSLTTFQAELKELYRQMKDESQTFHHTVAESVRKSELFQKEVAQALTSQSQHIRSLMVTMKSYEEAYVSQRGETDARLQELLTEAKKVYSVMVGKHGELVRELGEPLRGDVRAGLDAVGRSLENASEQNAAVNSGLSDLNKNVQALGRSVTALGQKAAPNGKGAKAGGPTQPEGAPDLSLFQVALMLVHVSETNEALAREVESLKRELNARKA